MTKLFTNKKDRSNRIQDFPAVFEGGFRHSTSRWPKACVSSKISRRLQGTMKQVIWPGKAEFGISTSLNDYVVHLTLTTPADLGKLPLHFGNWLDINRSKSSSMTCTLSSGVWSVGRQLRGPADPTIFIQSLILSAGRL